MCPAAPFGYQYQKTLEINFNKVGEFVANFPVLVSLTSPESNELRTISNGGRIYSNNGYDIIFTDANYNKLDHQIESYDPSSGNLVAWVRFPFISNGANTTFRILYSNSQVTTSQSVESVWNSSYKGVWHLNGSDFTDATVTGNDGAQNNTNSITGRIAGGRSFNGTSSYVRMNSLNGFVRCDEPQTISIWARYSSTPSAIRNFVSFQNSGASSSVQVGFAGSLPQVWCWGGGNLVSYGTAPSSNTWHYYVYTFDGTKHRLYIDGVYQENTTAGQAGIPTEGNLGRYNNGEYYNGWLDEARYSTNTKTAGWITTEYNNQNDQIIGAGHFIQSISAESEYNSPSNFNFNVCTGASVTYSIPFQAGHTYTWTVTGGAPASSNANPVTITWGASGTGTIQLKDNNGLCDGNSQIYNVTINPQPSSPTLNTKTPNLAAVCDGQAVSATFNAGTGGVGCTDSYQYRFDGAGGWNTYTPGNNLNTSGHTSVEIRGQRSGCTAGCSGTGWTTLASWNVNSQPTAPTLNTKTPNLAAVCDGQAVSATFNAGTGGVGCTDSYQYRFDGAGGWNAYTPGNNLNTAGHTLVEIQGRRSGCTAAAGCSGTGWATLASWNVNSQPNAPTLNTKTPNMATACDGQSVSATFNAGTGGVGCTDSYQYRFDGAGGWNTYTPGNNLNTTGHTLVEIQGQRSGCTAAAGCTGTSWVPLASWNVNPNPILTSSLTPPSICSGTVFSYTPASGTGGTS
ncbi:MAG TPA: hypothetical protein DCZ51_03430, partial [Bacteroidales bacterium]|nr:hypothetical protein [Bacteroidales bacterium]